MLCVSPAKIRDGSTPQVVGNRLCGGMSDVSTMALNFTKIELFFSSDDVQRRRGFQLQFEVTGANNTAGLLFQPKWLLLQFS